LNLDNQEIKFILAQSRKDGRTSVTYRHAVNAYLQWPPDEPLVDGVILSYRNRQVRDR
jgi:hypothetical protein